MSPTLYVVWCMSSHCAQFFYFLASLLAKCSFASQRLQQLVSLNVTAVTRMTKIVLPGMSDRQVFLPPPPPQLLLVSHPIRCTRQSFRRRGAIVNISSGSGTFPCPMLTVYSATKAYMDFFSRGLEAEVASRGVIVQSVTPFFVASKLSKLRPSLTTPTPAAYCRQVR